MAISVQGFPVMTENTLFMAELIVQVTRRKMRDAARNRWTSTEERTRMSQAYRDFWRKKTGTCALCGQKAALVRDHDHTTGKIRGNICGRCNTGLGFLGDTADSLRRALAYLERT